MRFKICLVVFLTKRISPDYWTDYNFQGYHLRKDFPVSVFTESRYSVTKNKVVFENVELA